MLQRRCFPIRVSVRIYEMSRRDLFDPDASMLRCDPVSRVQNFEDVSQEMTTFAIRLQHAVNTEMATVTAKLEGVFGAREFAAKFLMYFVALFCDCGFLQ